MKSFTKTPNGVRVALDEAEVSILRQTATEVLQIVTDRDSTSEDDDPLARLVGISSHDQLPDNPILARLFPNAYQDEKAANEFRRYTESTLREKKSQALVDLLAVLPVRGELDIELADDAIDEWLRAINDLRLALGVILNIDADSEERFAALDEDDPSSFTFRVFHWLGWLQANLIEHAVTS